MYLIDEARIAIPESWQDKTMNMFIPETGNGSFVITRDFLAGEPDFAAYVALQVGNLGTMPGYTGLDSKEIMVSARPAYLHEYKWMNEQSEVHQILTIVNLGEKVLVLTRTSETAFSDAERSQLKDLLTSVELTVRQ